ncbi:MAG: hypothetical protein SGPRY_003622, partial [Prymnesium sp.]
VDTRPGYALEGVIYKNIYAGELRGRACNVGSLEAGPWSNIVILEPDKGKSGEPEIPARPKKEDGSKKAGGGLSKAESMVAEGGIAVIAQEDIETMMGKKFTANKKMGGWSPFRQVGRRGEVALDLDA